MHGVSDAAKLLHTSPSRGVDDVAFDVFDRLGTSDFCAFGAQYPCPHAPLPTLQPDLTADTARFAEKRGWLLLSFRGTPTRYPFIS